MSRLYFTTPTQEAALSGAEYQWMRHLAFGASDEAWDLDQFDGAERLLSWVEEVPEGQFGANYLHRHLREAHADPGLAQRLFSSLRTKLHTYGLDLRVEGVTLRSMDVAFNTAIVTGSDPVVLATKMYGWGGLHAWIDGPDRAWAADIIDTGLETGVLRRGLGWEARFADHDPGNGVLALLRDRDDEPVVLSYSVEDHFPNPTIAGRLDTPPPTVCEDTEALDGWTDNQWEEFGNLTAQQQWDLAFAGLRERRPWAQLSPATLRAQYFSWPVTAFDLMRPDRADRLREILAQARAWQVQHVR